VSKQIKQESITTSFSKVATGSIAATQTRFEQSLVEMLIEDMQPIGSVERSGFQKFCKQCILYCKVPNRRALNRRLQHLYESSKIETTEAFGKAKWMSATADVWSAHKRAFMGITVHYVNHETLRLESVALCCRRFRHAHTGEAIAKMLHDILQE
jgi:hypothetical protein